MRSTHLSQKLPQRRSPLLQQPKHRVAQIASRQIASRQQMGAILYLEIIIWRSFFSEADMRLSRLIDPDDFDSVPDPVRREIHPAAVGGGIDPFSIISSPKISILAWRALKVNSHGPCRHLRGDLRRDAWSVPAEFFPFHPRPLCHRGRNRSQLLQPTFYFWHILPNMSNLTYRFQRFLDMVTVL